MLQITIQLACGGDSYTHVAIGDQDDGHVSRIVAVPGKPMGALFRTHVPTMLMRLFPSPEGKLLYLELTDKHNYRRTGPSSPDDVHLKLHICNEQGQDLMVIPLRNQNGKGYNYGCFYGENIVGLYEEGRNLGRIQETFVFLDTQKVQYWGRWEEGEEIGVSLSPDKTKILCQVSKGKEKLGIVYINGRQVYPICDENAMPKLLGAEDYAKGAGKTAKWLRANPGNYFLGHSLTRAAERNLWSPDSRFCVLMKQPYRNPERAPEKGVRGLEYVVIDTEKAQPANPRRDYIKTYLIDVTLEEAYNRRLHPVWSDDAQTVGLSSERRTSRPKRSHERRVGSANE